MLTPKKATFASSNRPRRCSTASTRARAAGSPAEPNRHSTIQRPPAVSKL
jgi:hypothetical protein